MKYKNLYQVDFQNQLSKSICFFADDEDVVKSEMIRRYGQRSEGAKSATGEYPRGELCEKIFISLVAEGWSGIYDYFPK